MARPTRNIVLIPIVHTLDDTLTDEGHTYRHNRIYPKPLKPMAMVMSLYISLKTSLSYISAAVYHFYPTVCVSMWGIPEIGF
jgi:hypothetical protein